MDEDEKWGICETGGFACGDSECGCLLLLGGGTLVKVTGENREDFGEGTLVPEFDGGLAVCDEGLEISAWLGEWDGETGGEGMNWKPDGEGPGEGLGEIDGT